MSNWSEQQFTRKGAELRAKVEAGKCKLALTKMKIGNGSVTPGEVDRMTDLKNPQLVFGISSCTVSEEDSTVCKTVGIASSTNVENSFLVSEMGIYATDPDIGEILYLVCIDSVPDTMPNKRVASPVTLTYQFDIVTSNTANVTAVITPTGLATAKMVNDHRTAAELDHPEKSVHKKHLHADAYESPALTGTPTAPTAARGTNTAQIANTAFVAQAIAALVNSSPAALDTLQELAKAIGNDPNFATTILNKIAEKVSKSGDTMSGNLNLGKALNFTGGVTSAGIWPGQKDVGDPIAAQDANLIIASWFGIGFYDMCNKQVSCGIDTRTGNYLTNGKVITKGGVEGNLNGTADNASKLGGKSLADILGKITAQNTGGIVASSIAQNGWVKFANGLIIQWGTIDGLSSAARSYAFPIEFPNKAFMITGGSVSYEYGVTLKTASNAQFVAAWWPDELGTPQNGNPVQFIAIGH
ncbi:hypothetical protein HMPREF1147_1737 [Selenomonas sp. FOBRC9]|uniref:gp53-like domain-containing protein n=1 Tax=Selenomonas sp. FOBRC9 TaxID=936573 RepID=UPI00027A415C|nr:tail fiber protein [Selenomonas sp. FOBRC9]EJP28289.1 hypothetical protein HMPREF1147_1737 [Selenomonas sp. FOBRC9]